MRATLRLAWATFLAAYAVAAPAPTPQNIIDEYLQAQGGGRVVAQIRSEIVSGNLTEESTGRTGSFSLITATPDRFFMEIIAGPDRVAEAYNGMSAWGQDPTDGLHTLTSEAAKHTEPN